VWIDKIVRVAFVKCVSDFMPSPGSLIRWIVGLLLAGEVLRDWIFGGTISIYAGGLAVLFLALSAIWIIFRF